jgi:hypothetical protein
MLRVDALDREAEMLSRSACALANPRRCVVAALFMCAVLSAPGCGGGQGTAGAKFEPARPGVLTVATAFLSAPGSG